MRKIIFAFLICLIVQQVCGQGNYYIYIQAEDSKPFYVRSGSKVFQSSGNGYLLIPDLATDTYELIVGFPENAGIEWRFNCAITEKDLGFVLKNNHSKGVELSGLRQEKGLAGTRVENKPEKKPTAVKQATGIISEDPFSVMLAQVVNDPTIKQHPTIILKASDSLNMANAAKKADSLLTASKLPVVEKKTTTVDSLSIAKSSKNAEKKPDSSIAVASPSLSNVDKKATVDSLSVAKSSKTAQKKVDSSLTAAALSSASEKKPVVVDSVNIAKSSKNNAEKNADSIFATAKAPVSSVPVIEKKATVDSSSVTKSLKTAEKKKDSSLAVVPPVAEKKAAVDSLSVTKSTRNDKTKKGDSSVVSAKLPTAPTVDKKAAVVDSLNIAKATKAAEKKIDSNLASSTLPAANKNTLTETKATPQSVIKSTTTAPVVEVRKVVASSSAIKKTLQRKSNDGIELIYIDEMTDGTKDTIRILIPAQSK